MLLALEAFNIFSEKVCIYRNTLNNIKKGFAVNLFFFLIIIGYVYI